jgi:hypothetical protein
MLLLSELMLQCRTWDSISQIPAHLLAQCLVHIVVEIGVVDPGAFDDAVTKILKFWRSCSRVHDPMKAGSK